MLALRSLLCLPVTMPYEAGAFSLTAVQMFESKVSGLATPNILTHWNGNEYPIRVSLSVIHLSPLGKDAKIWNRFENKIWVSQQQTSIFFRLNHLRLLGISFCLFSAAIIVKSFNWVGKYRQLNFFFFFIVKERRKSKTISHSYWRTNTWKFISLSSTVNICSPTRSHLLWSYDKMQNMSSYS